MLSRVEAVLRELGILKTFSLLQSNPKVCGFKYFFMYVPYLYVKMSWNSYAVHPYRQKDKEIMGRNVQKQSIRILIPKKIPKSSHASGFTVIPNLEDSILPFSSPWINYPLGNFTAFQRFILKKMLLFHTNHASFLFLIHLFIHPFNQQILVD